MLRWFGYLKGKKSEIEDPRKRGRPVVRWKDRVKKYMHRKVVD